MATSPVLRRLLALQQRLADLDAEQRQADADDSDGDSDEAVQAAPATLEASHQLMFAPIGERWHVHYHGPAASTGDTEQPSLPSCWTRWPSPPLPRPCTR